MSRSEVRPPIPLVKRAGRPPSATRRKPVELRTCRHHGLVEFALYGKAKPKWRCKRCVGEAVTRRKQKIKRTLVDEAGGSCAICGYDRCIINLHFHHVDPSAKSFGLTMKTTKALAAYREEVKKCVLVCANCHGEIEAGQIESPPAGSVFPALFGPGLRPLPSHRVATSSLKKRHNG